MTQRRKDLRGFLWQTLWLVLPVTVLAGIGLYLSRLDRFMVEREARERAREWSSTGITWLYQAVLSQDLAAFTNYAGLWPSGQVFFQVDQEMRLVFPPNVARAQSGKPLDELPPEASELWSEAERLEFAANDLPSAIAAWARVLEIELPPQLRALAAFNRAVLLAKAARTDEAVADLTRLRDAPLQARTEAGFPVRHLAGIKLMALLPENQGAELAMELAMELGRQLLQEPTEASPLLLRQGAQDRPRAAEILQVYAALWEQHEKARYLHGYARGLMRNERSEQLENFHAADPGNQWYGVVWNGTNAFAATGPVLSAMLQKEQGRAQVPQYLALNLFWDGNPLSSAPPHVSGELLAQSFADGFETRVYLANPQALFAMQRQRAIWIAGIIGVAVVAALVGILSNYRAHLKQRRLNDMKDNFVSSVSHEFRAPLASMRLLAEGLQSGRVGGIEKQREYYDYLVQECRRLSLLVENVLDFSRIEQGRKEYDFQECDLGKVLHGALRSVDPIAQEHAVTLEMKAPAVGEFVAEVDGIAIQQALINLLDNAIKHSPKGERVTVNLERKGGRAEIAVVDRGPGIPEPERQRVFERFYRLGSELRRETAGVGIGLSLVQHTIEAHGGRVRVESAPEKGSVFIIDLPLPGREGP